MERVNVETFGSGSLTSIQCDGNHPCARCLTHDEPKCHYDVSTRISKEAMREEIEILKAYKDASERVLGALAIGQVEEESPQAATIVSRVIDALRSGQEVQEISQFLEEEKPLPNSRGQRQGKSEVIRDDLARSPTTTQPTTSSGSSSVQTPATYATHLRDMSVDRILAPTTNMTSTASSTASHKHSLEVPFDVTNWTSVTSDVALIETLMAYYFCWEYPIFASISKVEFLADYFAGNPRWCSELLVNAMLAVGHRFAAANTSDPLAHRDSCPEMGMKFQAEAERLLEEEDGRRSLCAVQALGMLSIREASMGRNTQSWGYSCASIRMAVEMGLHYPSPEGTRAQENDVRIATFWGAFALDQ